MNSMHFVNSLELQSISQMFKKKKIPFVESANNMLQHVNFPNALWAKAIAITCHI
jgi:hypothetical protein